MMSDSGRPWHAGHAVLALLALAAIPLAVRAWAAATAPLPLPPPFAAPQMADRALLARVDPFAPLAAGSGDSLPVTALPFSLHGLRADGATGRGSAIIATSDGRQALYAVGDTLGSGATLAAIAIDHVVLDVRGRREALWLDTGGAAPVERFAPPGLDVDTDLPESAPPTPDPGPPAARPDLPADPPPPPDVQQQAPPQ